MADPLLQLEERLAAAFAAVAGRPVDPVVRASDRAALLAATSALSAVVTSAVLHHQRAGHPEARTAAMVAVVVALTLATRKVSMLRVIVAGLAVYELTSLALAAI